MKKLLGAMIIGVGFLAVAVLAQAAQAAEKTQPLSLSDCFALALKQSETIAINRERIREAEAHFLQAFGTVIPNVSFSWSQTRQNSDNSPSYNRAHESKFIFKQTLFSGFKEFAAIAGSGSEKKQREYEKSRAEQLLFVDVADAFYLLLELSGDLKAQESARQALLDRIEELKQREAIGRSRASEIASAQTQLYNVEADIELAKSSISVAEDLMEFLIGQPVGEVVDKDPTEASLKEKTEYLTRIDARPDVIAAWNAWDVTRKNVTVAKSGLLPTVTVEGNYYTHRNTAPTDSPWSTVLKVEAPIFEGTTTYGDIKEANALARESQLTYLQTRRLALQDIQDSYVNVCSSRIQSAALDKAVKAAELNYSLQVQDYQHSLVSNIDVLTALQNLENTRRNYIHTFYESKRYYWQLLAAVGEITVEK